MTKPPAVGDLVRLTKVVQDRYHLNSETGTVVSVLQDLLVVVRFRSSEFSLFCREVERV